MCRVPESWAIITTAIYYLQWLQRPDTIWNYHGWCLIVNMPGQNGFTLFVTSRANEIGNEWTFGKTPTELAFLDSGKSGTKAMCRIEKSCWWGYFKERVRGKLCLSGFLAERVLYQVEMLWIAAYSKPNNGGLKQGVISSHDKKSYMLSDVSRTYAMSVFSILHS